MLSWDKQIIAPNILPPYKVVVFYVAISSSWNCHQTNQCGAAVELSTLWWWEFVSAHLTLIYLRLRGKRALSWLPRATNHKTKFDLISSWFVQQTLQWTWYSLTRGKEKEAWCALVWKGKRGGKSFTIIHFDTKQQGQGPSNPPVLPVTRGRKSSVEVTGV